MPPLFPSARCAQRRALTIQRHQSPPRAGLSRRWAGGAVAALCGLVSTHCGVADERMLLAADNQVVEINRSGTVTDSISTHGHSGIYEAWRLPDGGIAYAHKGGLAVFDRHKNLVLAHAAKNGPKGTEANSCAVLDGGARFALMDSGVAQIRVVNRKGEVLSETQLPELAEDALHSRYRTVRVVPGEKAFWVAQYGKRTLLKVAAGTGEILQRLLLDPMLKPTSATHMAFGVSPLPGGALWVATSTGKQLLKLTSNGDVARAWTAQELGLKCRYLLGTQQLQNGRLLVACGDYHLKTMEEGADLLAEIDADGRIVWRLTRDQLVDQIEGVIDSKSGLEEMRITNVHAYDSDRLEDVLQPTR